MRSYWINQVVPKFNNESPYKRQGWRRPCEDGSKDWSYTFPAKEYLEPLVTVIAKEGFSPPASQGKALLTP